MVCLSNRAYSSPDTRLDPCTDGGSHTCAHPVSDHSSTYAIPDHTGTHPQSDNQRTYTFTHRSSHPRSDP